MSINKILIANRGEISLRIMRTAKEMGIKTVAVYSEADRSSPHVHYADQAVCLGPAPSAQSYLLADKLIEVAKALQADSIHPGYGFLSENASFARKVQQAGLVFIGPSAESMETMGDKLAARRAVAEYDVPMIPGTRDAITDIAVAKETARKIGYPVLIKASAGGGGKGMRIVEAEKDLEAQMSRAVSEAESAFGDGRVFLEKYFTSPRHIEIQILGDQHGNLVHLFERECSIQRRHQKVIEEAPSSILTAEKRKAMGETALKVAKACNYHSAGTVEFIVDENMDFYFLEINTRLQVEHPVTEMITGKDLVREQILIAEGKPLGFAQEDLHIHGHSIEVRVYAENPKNGFLPDTGRLVTYQRPQGPGVRVDDGFEEGMDVPIYYDPLIGKLIVYDQTRAAAIERMIRAIDEFRITGVQNTLYFCKFAMKHPAFRSGEFHTGFIDKYFNAEKLEDDFNQGETNLLAAIGVMIHESQNNQPFTSSPVKETTNSTKWKKNRLK